MTRKNIFLLFNLVILLFVIFFPSFTFDFDISTILTVVTLLFTILVGFFIAAATSNYLRLQTIISNEDANLISIYDLVKILQPSAKKKVGNLIDEYMISALDYDLLNYIDPTSKETQKLFRAIDKIIPSSEQNLSLIQNLQTIKSTIVSLRQEAEILVKRIVTKRHWFILITLTIIISVILLSLRSGSIANSLLMSLIIITLYQTLRLLHQIDSNEFLADQLAYITPQKVFLAIEKHKYFPETALDEKIKKTLVNETYRVGVYKNFPETMEKKIKIVRQ